MGEILHFTGIVVDLEKKTLPAGILPSVRNRSLNPSPSSLSIGESRPKS